MQIVKTTGPSLAKLLFRNNTNVCNEVNCGNCIICRSGGMNDTGVVKSTVTGKSYRIPKNLNCCNGGIYVFEGPCED